MIITRAKMPSGLTFYPSDWSETGQVSRLVQDQVTYSVAIQIPYSSRTAVGWKTNGLKQLGETQAFLLCVFDTVYFLISVVLSVGCLVLAW